MSKKKPKNEVTTLLIKLASIAVHADEMLSPDGHHFDKEVIRSLLTDSEVRAFLDAKENQVYLPLKRNKR